MFLKYQKILLIASVFLISSGSILLAQDHLVEGVVSDSEKQALLGVTIAIKGKSEGVITDLEGHYQIVVFGSDSLIFSYVGMKSRTVFVGNQTNIDITLSGDKVDLEEVLIIGYGVVKKSDLTGAVGSVDSEELQKIASPNMIGSLQGQVAGVSIESANGSQPGGNINIKIRGTNTLTNNLPLYVVDGTITQNISQLNSSDIETMEILKDASACAIYGSRASNGVVIITTKNGKSGAPVISFNTYIGVQLPSKYLELTPLDEYHNINADVNNNSTSSMIPPGNDPASEYYIDSLDTDWQDLMLNPALIQNYSLSISGGNDQATYYASAGYVNQNGIVLGTGYKRYSVKLNSTVNKGKFRFTENLSMFKHSRDDESIGASGRGAIIEMLKITPNISPTDPGQLGGYGAVEPEIVGHAAKNPYGAAYLLDNYEDGYTVNGNVSGSYEFFEGFSYTLRAGLNLDNSTYISHKPMYYMGTEDNNLQSPTLMESSAENAFYIIENLLNFNRQFGKSSINAVVGYTYQESSFQTYTMSASGLPDNQIIQIGAGDPDGTSLTSYGSESTLVSLLGRFIYSYDSRYLLTATVRRDGSSRFSEDSKWGNFPSLSLGWNLHKEAFFPQQDIVTGTKLRISYGKLGNQEIGDYNYTGYINSNASYVFGLNQDLARGATQLSFPSQELKWEETTSYNAGADMSFMKNKITASFDYFFNITSDMLVWVPIPISAGSLPANVLQNYGEMESSGFEFSLNYKKSEGEFHYSLTANLTTEKNRVISLGSENPLWSGEYENGEGFTQKTMAGGSVGDFYLFHVDGIFQSEDEIEAYNQYYTDMDLPVPQSSVRPGDIRFLDADKNGVLNNDDKLYAGSPIPDFTGGISFNAEYKAFDFTMFWYGSYGNKIINGMRFWTESMSTNMNFSVACMERWTDDDHSSTMPRAVQGDPNGNSRPSDRWLEDGSYLRLKNLELGYSLSPGVLNRLQIHSMRIYLSAQNMLTFTSYSGYDPELGGNADLVQHGSITADGVKASRDRGVDRNIYPSAKTFLVGVQLSF